MLQLLNYRLKLTLADGRVFIGQMIGFDRHMNLVIADCEEYRTIKRKSGESVEEKRALGLIVLRGAQVVSMSVESPPPVGDSMSRQPAAPNLMAGMGIARPGMRPAMPPPGMPPMGLAGPIPGMGGPPGMRPPPMG
jgi:small nuclear ribonucleoprotein B and B'